MEPTQLQIGLVYKWLSWKLPRQEAKDAVSWLKNNATRKQVSTEISRLHDLYHSNKLNKETLYTGEIWEGFEHD